MYREKEEVLKVRWLKAREETGFGFLVVINLW
jgi:hypothetical protein